jgi:Tol biopolymer transport system component
VKKLVSLSSLPVGAGSPRSFCLALVFVLSISLAGAGSAADLAPKADAGGTIVFTRNLDDETHIYAVNPDGTGLTQLTNTMTGEYAPIPSPDGRLIAFHSDDEVPSKVMNADGSGQRPLTGCSTLRPGAWSPDSSKLVCEVGYEKGLAVADAASGAVTPLAPSGQYPTWSPDGRTIAFIDRERLWAVPAAGGAPRRLGNRKIDEEATPSWSPDSARLAYMGSAGTKFRQDLFTIGADGSGERRLVQRMSDFQTPQWSPEGSLIAFVKELPRDITAVYTVRPDGTGLSRVSVSPGRESSGDPAWSADGASLLYTRWRYRFGGGTDVFVTTPGAGAGRAVTHPFPAGGTNEAPIWMTGPPLTGGEPAPQTITLPLARKLTFSDPLDGLTTDGRRAIPYLHVDSGSSPKGVLVWDAVGRRTMRTPRLCTTAVVLAGRRLAWTCAEQGNTYLAIWLETLRLGARRPTFVTETIADEDGGDTIGSLIGHGGTIAFTSYHGKKETARAWLLLARHGSKCPRNSDLIGSEHPPAVCRRLKGAAGGVTASVDAGRVLTVAPNGRVRLLSTRDRVLRTWKLGRGIVNARLRGRALAVQHGQSLDVYDTATGAKRQTLPLAPDGGSRPFLLDVQRDVVVYATGGAIHLLRPSDGRDVALDLAGAAPSLDARLEPTGLFVTWNQMYSRRPGRMAFVPMRTVLQRFGRVLR